VKANSPNGIDNGTARYSLGHGKATQPLVLCLQTYFLNNVRRAWPWKIQHPAKCVAAVQRPLELFEVSELVQSTRAKLVLPEQTA
jgi:hypothetical protein